MIKKYHINEIFYYFDKNKLSYKILKSNSTKPYNNTNDFVVNSMNIFFFIAHIGKHIIIQNYT